MDLPDWKEGSGELEDDDRVRRVLCGLLDVPVRISKVERIRTEPKTSKPRHIRVTIEDNVARRNVLLRTKKLKEGTETRTLYIVPDDQSTTIDV